MTENKLLDLSFEFAVAIVNPVDGVTTPKSSYMADQLERAGTSVGANIHEAQYAQSNAERSSSGKFCETKFGPSQRTKTKILSTFVGGIFVLYYSFFIIQYSSFIRQDFRNKY